MVDETRFAIIEPDDYTRAFMRQGAHPGTIPGEIWRSATQFKGFPIAYMQRVMGGRRWVRGEKQRGLRRDGWGGIKDTALADIPGTIGFLISSIAFGYAAGVLKDLSKGRTPRDPRKQETWIAAVLQSGGAGIVGDIFLGSSDRFGNSALSALAGPVPGSLAGVGGLTQIVGKTARLDFSGAGHDAARFVVGHTPFVNLWYTRAAVDWLFLYHVREMLSPGSLRRSEKKMREEFNQEFLVRPSRYIKRGGGFR